MEMENRKPTPTSRGLRNTLKKSASVMVNGKLYGPTNYQISVWEYEGGNPMDHEDPLAHRKGIIKKTYNYFARNFQSLF